MTGQEVIDRAWTMVQDTEPTKRNPTSALVPVVNAGVYDLLARRPGISLDADGALASFTALTTSTVATQELPVGDEYAEGLAHYVAWRIFEQDADDEHNAGLAQYHRDLYMRET